MQLTKSQSPQLNQPTSSRSGLVGNAVNRLVSVPPWVLLIQLFIGLGWTRAGVEKLISSRWWDGTELELFLIEHGAITVAWYLPFVDLVVMPGAVAVSLIVMVVQFVLGAALLTNRKVGLALIVGMFLNLNFIAAGAVAPSVFYLLAQGAVLLWIAEQSRERWTIDALEFVMMAGAVLAAISIPWIRTLAPAEVIDDPALMLSTVGAFSALCSFLTYYRRREGQAVGL